MISDTLKAQLEQLRKTQEVLVLAAAKELPDFGFTSDYADSNWDVQVDQFGNVYNKGYARELHGRVRKLSDLKNWELGKLVDEIERRTSL